MKTSLRIFSLLLTAVFILQAAPEPDFVEGEVLVLYKQTSAVKGLPSADVVPAGQTRKTFSQLSARAGKKMQLIRDRTRTTAELAAAFQANPNVEAVSPNYIKRVFTPARIPDDTLFGTQWALHNTEQAVQFIAIDTDGDTYAEYYLPDYAPGEPVYSTTGTADDDIDWTDARRLMKDNPPEAVIAVIDTGVSYAHLDLHNTMWINTNEIPGNAVDDDLNGYIDDVYGCDLAGDPYTDPDTSTETNDGPDGDPEDIGDHGTHVAGIAAAIADNGIGVAGVGRLKIMAIKVSDDGTTITDSATINAIDYILEMKSQGVNIVAANASYGGNGYDALEKVAIQQLNAAGIVLCAAAGNESVNNDTIPSYPANYNVANIISVAATDSDDALASYSNYGATTVDVAAPGSLLLSCAPPHMASDASVEQGAQTVSALGMSFSGITASNGISGSLINCGIGDTGDFPAAVAGNIALIERGTLYFTEKVSNAMDAGAVAAIIYNNTNNPANIIGDLMRPNGWIPSVNITQADGQTLLAFTNQTVTVINRQDETTAYQYKSGTSMATPVVTGAIGVLARHFPNDSVSERISRLLDNADPVAGLSGNCITGARINLAAALDSDGDELPDWWELEYAATLTAMNSSSDLDSDGMSNLSEYRTGTDPDNPASTWSVAIADTEGTLQFSWPSQAGCTYSVHASTNLADGFFELTNAIPSTPPLNAWSPPGTNSPQRFFRVEQTWE